MFLCTGNIPLPGLNLWRYTRRDTNILTEWSMTLLTPLSTKGLKKKKVLGDTHKHNACRPPFSANALPLRTPASGLFQYIFQWFSYRKISHFRIGRFEFQIGILFVRGRDEIWKHLYLHIWFIKMRFLVITFL